VGPCASVARGPSGSFSGLLTEGSLEAEAILLSIRADEAAEVGRIPRREKKEEEDQRRDKVNRKKIQAREKVEKVAKRCVFPTFCGSGGWKSRLAKAAGAEPSGPKLHAFKDKMLQKKLRVGTLVEVSGVAKKRTPLRREAHFEVKMLKTHALRRNIFGC